MKDLFYFDRRIIISSIETISLDILTNQEITSGKLKSKN